LALEGSQFGAQSVRTSPERPERPLYTGPELRVKVRQGVRLDIRSNWSGTEGFTQCACDALEGGVSVFGLGLCCTGATKQEYGHDFGDPIVM